MQVSLIVLRQTATMFLLMAVGFALYKAKKIDEPGSRSIASALLYAVMPATLINSLLLERTPANTALLVRSTLAAAAAMLLSVAAARLFYRKSGVETFAAAFPTRALWAFRWCRPPLGPMRRSASWAIWCFCAFCSTPTALLC